MNLPEDYANYAAMITDNSLVIFLVLWALGAVIMFIYNSITDYGYSVSALLVHCVIYGFVIGGLSYAIVLGAPIVLFVLAVILFVYAAFSFMSPFLALSLLALLIAYLLT